MQENIIILLMFIILLVAAFIQWVESAFIHELGHLKMARRYKYCKAEISLKYAWPLFKVKDCIIKRDKTLQCEGFTSLDNNYLVYTDEEVRNIAKAGTRAAHDFIMSVGLLSLSLLLVLRYTIQGTEKAFNRADYIIVISVIITILCALMNRWKYIRDNEWGDKEIVNNPSGYKEHIRKVIRNEQSDNPDRQC